MYREGFDRKHLNRNEHGQKYLSLQDVKLEKINPRSTSHRKERLLMRKYRLRKWTKTCEEIEQQAEKSENLKKKERILFPVNSGRGSKNVWDRAQNNLLKVKALLTTAHLEANNNNQSLILDDQTFRKNYKQLRHTSIENESVLGYLTEAFSQPILIKKRSDFKSKSDSAAQNSDNFLSIPDLKASKVTQQTEVLKQTTKAGPRHLLSGSTVASSARKHLAFDETSKNYCGSPVTSSANRCNSKQKLFGLKSLRAHQPRPTKGIKFIEGIFRLHINI